MNKSLNRIKKKLVANCNECDALCCYALNFETPKYKKASGTHCKNLNSETLKCQIYETRETQGYGFCLKFDCHGAGQTITRMFKTLGRNWQDNETIGKIQSDMFIGTYLYLSRHFFPNQKIQAELAQDTKENLSPFISEAIQILGNEINEKLELYIDKSLKRITGKLVADCDRCDELCLKSSKLETLANKKTPGERIKDLEKQKIKHRIHDTNKKIEYESSQKFDCHGAGQAVSILFQNFGNSWKNEEKRTQIQYEIFVRAYLYLTEHFFPDHNMKVTSNGHSGEELLPFIEAAIDILGKEINEDL